jgi:hypothetical protein
MLILVTPSHNDFGSAPILLISSFPFHFIDARHVRNKKPMAEIIGAKPK